MDLNFGDIIFGLVGLFFAIFHKRAGRSTARQQEKILNALGIKVKFGRAMIRAYELGFLLIGLLFTADSILRLAGFVNS